MDKPIRLKNIADKLGISLSTVSRVLNDKPGISQKTRDLVMNELKQHKDDFTPIIKSTMPSNGRFIGIIGRQRVGQLDSVYFHHSTLAFDETLHKQGYQSLVIPVSEEDMENPSGLRALQSDSCDGYILRGQSLSPRFIMEIQSLGKPIVLLENNLTENRMNCVVCDDREGAFTLTEHLINREYKNIIHITGPERWYNNKQRIAGYTEAMNKAGLDTIILQRNDTTIQTGEKVFDDIIDLLKERTAVFAVNDAMAIGLLNRARQERIEIPSMMAIAGFDDIPWASMTYPPLTTTHIHIEKMGELAALRILQLLADPDSPAVEMKMPVDLVIRETT
ncbi:MULTISPECIES: LacI family DNA-binding transcriptional regulator [unclassified Oceanispirochaeta]|uniref:LacI family DNA-binding transcriptional regulator n=1 Tax=unclassified Oceanispirochaeta TaxID=2635722 RepID=UPI000E094B13|nr:MULTISPECIES: LacI family DNA-binding transcriptional regulator [unclassified Oceanispirochaeta]MBF9014618.1 LacI family DNA-binding transcriptional regulator [Oceanispirochaeta sp. M2]NPD70874.1 LacI family transcriptional regulator [Oceanispirochaeta sp. M1]RDG34153.1 LacI family transcriptional regulator [Oceanispirochaeta sp. M1]